MTAAGDHPGVLYFYGESIALAANGCCAFVAALSNFGVIQRDVLPVGAVGGWFLVVGGGVQLLCECHNECLTNRKSYECSHE